LSEFEDEIFTLNNFTNRAKAAAGILRPRTQSEPAGQRPHDRSTSILDTPPAIRHVSPSFSQNIMKPTFRPHRKKRARKIGYRARMATAGGQKVIKARRLKGRKRLTVV
jgi:large subunit ribosomal protein L34